MIKQFSLLVFLSALLFTTVSPTFAQGEAVDPAEDMQKLAMILGEWNGEGWMRNQSGQHFFNQKENVVSKVNGHVIIIDGLGFDKDDPEHIIHNAFAVLSYDSETEQVMINAYLANGNTLRVPLEVTEDGFAWGYEIPQGQIRNTAIFTDDQWYEKTEFSPDGEQWFQSLEFTLNRTN